MTHETNDRLPTLRHGGDRRGGWIDRAAGRAFGDEGELPTFEMDRTVCARRSTLAEHFAAQEPAAAAAADRG